MYSYEDRLRAVKLYIKYDCCEANAIRELGYPSRKMLTRWYKEYIVSGDIPRNIQKNGKYSHEEKKKAVDYYFDHGQCISRTSMALGYPSRPTMRLWIDEFFPSYL